LTRAFIGLGSNLGDRAQNLRQALAALRNQGIEIRQTSSIYETDPVGPPQPDFLNAAAEIETSLPPLDLLATLKQTETEQGREPGEPWGPRLIDLDLLLYGTESINEPNLTIPHPELTKRAFALVPLLEIDPNLELPSGEPLSAFLERNPKGIQKTTHQL
jgi:2-amino-4-hydroxy-6-hydroxymethyldihydropteridine diphosphokinase